MGTAPHPCPCQETEKVNLSAHFGVSPGSWDAATTAVCSAIADAHELELPSTSPSSRIPNSETRNPNRPGGGWGWGWQWLVATVVRGRLLGTETYTARTRQEARDG